jgi:hypothetical protein
LDYNYFIAEMNAVKANVERLIREAEQAQAEEATKPPRGQPSQHPPAPQPSEIRDPLAKSMADLVTPKQLGLIRALAHEAALDPDEECQAEFRCKTEDLSKRAASSFIDHLKNKVTEFAQPRKVS